MKKNIMGQKKKKTDTAGSTMVEVLVAFLIVMIMVVMFSKVIAVSADMLKRSRQMTARYETFNENYYKTENIKRRSAVGGLTLRLSVDTEKTASGNKAKEASLELSKTGLQVYTDTETGLKMYSFRSQEGEPETD
ncbi:type IV pilus modification PilV family protein [Qiania dongpingensis]|uniref:Uncharacterized protein n=1 Tax=Qiania dongpingensis TaxID=2763669 RepID=A0A7G9G5P5_9FIRM|nr:hypothetical protein [Qiania dongpingensis]QNM06127.1 hypothetical protein H9Q78_02915 [Qiania dongpingensis]